MSTSELRKRVIEQVKVLKDVKLLRELDRLLEGAGQEVASSLTTAEQRRSISRSGKALKKGKVSSAAEVDNAVRKWLDK